MTAAPPLGTGIAVDVELSEVTVRFTTRRARTSALDRVSLRVRAGEFLTVVGPSGCGKSTLLKVVAGLVPPTSGQATLLGRPVAGAQKDIGFVFQRAALLEWRNVRQNIMLQAEMRGMDSRKAAARTDGLIAMTGLTGFEKALPHELSGGMQQRVALCRALLHEPPVLLMDEPFGALDALTREQMNAELHRIWLENGTTVVLVTHSIAEAVFLGTRVAVMSPRPGRILRTFDVDLGEERDYARAMSDPRFERLASEVRHLLGASV